MLNFAMPKAADGGFFHLLMPARRRRAWLRSGKAADESVSQARADRRGKGRVGSTACLLARHHRGKYNIRSADSVVGDSGSQDRE